MKQVILILILASAACSLQAQPPQAAERQQRMESMKIAFLTRALSLTPAEAKVFWPVYDQMQKEQEELQSKRKRPGPKGLEGMSDKEIEALVDRQLELAVHQVDLKKKYHEQFKAVLPIQKVARLYHAEEEFKREMLQRIRGRMDEGRRPPREEY